MIVRELNNQYLPRYAPLREEYAGAQKNVKEQLNVQVFPPSGKLYRTVGFRVRGRSFPFSDQFEWNPNLADGPLGWSTDSDIQLIKSELKHDITFALL